MKLMNQGTSESTVNVCSVWSVCAVWRSSLCGLLSVGCFNLLYALFCLIHSVCCEWCAWCCHSVCCWSVRMNQFSAQTISLAVALFDRVLILFLSIALLFPSPLFLFIIYVLLYSLSKNKQIINCSQIANLFISLSHSHFWTNFSKQSKFSYNLSNSNQFIILN